MSNRISYRDKLLQLIPSEAVVAYTTVGAIAQNFIEDRFTILIVMMIGLTILLPFYLRFAVGDRSAGRVAVITISFVIWASNIDPPFAQFTEYQTWYASIPLVLWTFAMPIFNLEGGENDERKPDPA